MLNDLVFSNLDKCSHIIVKENVLETIKPYTLAGEIRTEAGGIFLGEIRGDHILITDCTTPFHSDLRAANTFYRQDNKHQIFAAQKWVESKGTKIYVGEWHTHREIKPSPSNIDLETWKSVQKKLKPYSFSLFFMIFGYEDYWAGLSDGSILAQYNNLNL